MKSTPTLESRIARIAEQYGDGLLRSYATEAGEMEKDHGWLCSPLRAFLFIYFGAACGVFGVVIWRQLHLAGWL